MTGVGDGTGVDWGVRAVLAVAVRVGVSVCATVGVAVEITATGWDSLRQ